MKFALSLPNAAPPDRLVEIARRADANGWDAVFLWDHIHLIRAMQLDLHDPWVVLGAMAASTQSVKLGTMVTPLPRRRPQKFAKEVVTLDHLSGGRVIVGVGLGEPADDEYSMFGEDSHPRSRAERLDEALQLVESLWTGEAIEHHGSHFDVSAQLRPAPLQQPRPPIWIAGTWGNAGPLRRAQRYDAYFPIGHEGPVGIDELRQASKVLEPGVELIGSWMPGPSIDDYDSAGVGWLVDSRWPTDDWLEELEDTASRDPRSS